MTWVVLRRANEQDTWQLQELVDDKPQDLTEPGEYRLIDTESNNPPEATIVPAADAVINQMRGVAQAIRNQSGLAPLTYEEAAKLTPFAVAFIKDPSLVDKIDLNALTGGTT